MKGFNILLGDAGKTYANLFQWKRKVREEEGFCYNYNIKDKLLTLSLFVIVCVGSIPCH